MPTTAGIDAKQSFAGSDDLAAQIRQGVTPDVYAAANTSLPGRALQGGPGREARRLRDQQARARGARRTPTIDSIDDLAGADVTLAIGEEGVPVGDYTREVLGAPARGPRRRRSSPTSRSEEPDVAGIVGKLTQGAVDAGLRLRHRCRRDRRRAGGGRSAGRASSPTSPTAPRSSKGAENPSGAQQFIDGLLDGDGAEALEAAGFGPPPRAERAHARPVRGRPASPRWRSTLAFLVLPIVAIFAEHAARRADRQPRRARSSRDALWLSLKTKLRSRSR